MKCVHCEQPAFHCGVVGHKEYFSPMDKTNASDNTYNDKNSYGPNRSRDKPWQAVTSPRLLQSECTSYRLSMVQSGIQWRYEQNRYRIDMNRIFMNIYEYSRCCYNVRNVLPSQVHACWVGAAIIKIIAGQWRELQELAAWVLEAQKASKKLSNWILEYLRIVLECPWILLESCQNSLNCATFDRSD